MIWLCVLVVRVTAEINTQPFTDNNVIDPYIIFRSNNILDDRNVTAVFPQLQNVDNDADTVPESKYKWIARVVHSRTANNPHMCTASCIGHSIFITAATCVASLKIEHTSVIYNGHWLRMKAMVIPAKFSRQGFDDIGFLVGYKTNFVEWHTVKLYDGPNRTDNVFKWFETYWRGSWDYYAVGFSAPAREAENFFTDKQYYLTELEVVMNYKICPRFLPPASWQIYRVPCFLSCADDDSRYYIKDNKIVSTGFCAKWHQVAGAALISKSYQILMGVGTWSLGLGKLNLPIGLAIPNSENFYKNYRCAIKIRDDPVDLKPGHYQSLCKD